MQGGTIPRLLKGSPARLGARMCVVTKLPKVTVTAARLGTTDERAAAGHCLLPCQQGEGCGQWR